MGAYVPRDRGLGHRQHREGKAMQAETRRITAGAGSPVTGGYTVVAGGDAWFFMPATRASRRSRTWVMASSRLGRGMAPGRRSVTNFRVSAYVIPSTQQR